MSRIFRIKSLLFSVFIALIALSFGLVGVSKADRSIFAKAYAKLSGILYQSPADVRYVLASVSPPAPTLCQVQTYDPARLYNVGELVSYTSGGTTKVYRCKLRPLSVNTLPTNTAYWNDATYSSTKSYTVGQLVLYIPIGATTPKVYSCVKTTVAATGYSPDNPTYWVDASNDLKPSDYLANYQTLFPSIGKPIFRTGYTLPRLAQSLTGGLSAETNLELAGNWGYALYLGSANAQKMIEIYDSDSDQAKTTDPEHKTLKKIEEAKKDPTKYPLQVDFETDLIPYASYPPDAWCHDKNGNIISGCFSPETPADFLREYGEKAADYLRQINNIAPIAIILNNGERRLTYPYESTAKNDPKVVAAQGTKSWVDYISEKKAYQESFFSDAARAAVPNHQLYIFYFSSAGAMRNMGAKDQYFFGYDQFRGVTDLPSESMYYGQFNYSFSDARVATQPPEDMLTQVLNATGRQIELGQPLSYNYVSGGWWPGGDVHNGYGPLDRYLGFLKMYYMAGNIGSIAGYFNLPGLTAGSGIGAEGYSGFDACFDPNTPFIWAEGNSVTSQPNSTPNWMLQFMALSQVHAGFSWLEPFLRNGDLLTDNTTTPIKKSPYSEDQPAYELIATPVSGGTALRNTRVMARKMKNADKWIVAAWAADGAVKDVRVNVPGYGNVTVHAIPEGQIYYISAVGAPPIIIDTNPNNPSIGAAAAWNSTTNPPLPH